MKRKHFSVEQMVAVLKQAEPGMPVADILRHVVAALKRLAAQRKAPRSWINKRGKSTLALACRMLLWQDSRTGASWMRAS
jgi:hypothetical protein